MWEVEAMFHVNLKRYREEKGLTQATLAEALAVSLRNVQNWEQGQREPSLETLRQLARVLGVTVSDLVEGEPPAKPGKRKRGKA
jgi:transcriptional regulator with XRE-family HTH domain